MHVCAFGPPLVFGGVVWSWPARLPHFHATWPPSALRPRGVRELCALRVSQAQALGGKCLVAPQNSPRVRRSMPMLTRAHMKRPCKRNHGNARGGARTQPLADATASCCYNGLHVRESIVVVQRCSVSGHSTTPLHLMSVDRARRWNSEQSEATLTLRRPAFAPEPGKAPPRHLTPHHPGVTIVTCGLGRLLTRRLAGGLRVRGGSSVWSASGERVVTLDVWGHTLHRLAVIMLLLLGCLGGALAGRLHRLRRSRHSVPCQPSMQAPDSLRGPRQSGPNRLT